MKPDLIEIFASNGCSLRPEQVKQVSNLSPGEAEKMAEIFQGVLSSMKDQSAAGQWESWDILDSFLWLRNLKTLGELYEYCLAQLAGRFFVEDILIFYFNDRINFYELKTQMGYEDYPIPEFHEHDPLIRFFEKIQQPRTVDETLSELDLNLKENPLFQQTSVISPITNKERVQGLILLGERLNHIAWTDYEKVIFGKITNIIGSAIENQILRIEETTDWLTGLHSRKRYDKLLHEFFVLAKSVHLSLSLLMIDIDHFKKINDTHGHAAGDRVLQSIGEMMQEALRENDYACRYGGEEIAILLMGIDHDNALRLAERIRARVAEHETEFTGTGIRCTVSIGVSSLRKDIPTALALQEDADRALYHSKNHGRNRVSSADELFHSAG